MHKRYCTMPKIPWFRDWFEDKFGDLCQQHDAENHCKVCGDLHFVLGIARRGYWWLVLPVWLAVNLPWVWLRWWRR